MIIHENSTLTTWANSNDPEHRALLRVNERVHAAGLRDVLVIEVDGTTDAEIDAQVKRILANNGLSEQ